jgi:hypothetical protein
MMAFAWMVLMAAPAGGRVVDEVHQIPAGDWKYKEIHLRQEAARISASYEVLEGSTKVRVALMLREDLERMREDLPGSIAVTGEGRSGRFADKIRRRGDYVVVLDNQEGKQAATVHLRVWLDFAAGRGTDAKRLSPQRQFTVVAISCAVFLGIVTFSARRLWRAVKS